MGLSDALIVTKATGEILVLNATKHCTGWSRVESLGKELSEIVRVHDGDGREVWPSLFSRRNRTRGTAGFPPTGG